MKTSILLITTILSLCAGLASAKEVSPLVLAGIQDAGLNSHVTTSKIDYHAALQDTLRLLAVDISMEKSNASADNVPVIIKTDQPGLGGEGN